MRAFLRHSSLPSAWIGPPKSSISAAQYSERTAGHLQEIEAPSSVVYQTLSNSGVVGSEVIDFSAASVLTIPEGRVIERDGWVVTDDECFLADVALHPPKSDEPLEKHPIFRRLHLPRIVRVDERVAVIAAEASACYYHWMFDILPKLELLRRAGASYDKIYTSALRAPFQKETLRAMGIEERELIQGDRGLQIQAKELIVPIHPTHTFVGQPWICQFLRQKFLSPEVESLPGGKRIYITRSRAQVRRLLNEQELQPLFDSYQIEVVALETLTVAEQVKLFNTCEWIIFPHGACLTNLAFCRPGTLVVEIMPPDCEMACGHKLCQTMGLPYHRLVAEKAFRSGYERLRNYLHLKDRYRDSRLSPEKLSALLQTIKK